MTREMRKNSDLTNLTARLERLVNKELGVNYAQALTDMRGRLAELYEMHGVTNEFTKAQLAQFVRVSNAVGEIENIAAKYIASSAEAAREVAKVGFEASFFKTAWSAEIASGVDLTWNVLSPQAVASAAGISDDYGMLSQYMSEAEILKHKKVLDDAFAAYSDNSRKYIGRAVKDGITKGQSVQQVAKRLKDEGLAKSRRQAETIARTELLRASGLGGQIASEQAEDAGIRIRHVWDATLDDRTRPDHAAMDGRVMDAETGLFETPWGTPTPGPHRTGIAAQDINCRCVVVEEVEGFEPEVRRIRNEGIQPYKTFDKWATDKGYTVNKYGQKYNFVTRE